MSRKRSRFHVHVCGEKLLVPFDTSKSCGDFLQEVQRRAKKHKKLRDVLVAHGDLVDLRIDAPNGPQIDLDDAMEDVLEADDDIFAISVLELQQMDAELTKRGPVAGEQNRESGDEVMADGLDMKADGGDWQDGDIKIFYSCPSGPSDVNILKSLWINHSKLLSVLKKEIAKLEGFDLEDAGNIHCVDLFWSGGHVIRESDGQDRDMKQLGIKAGEHIYVNIRHKLEAEQPDSQNKIKDDATAVPFYENFSAKSLPSNSDQTQKGLSLLMSCLHVLAHRLEEDRQSEFLKIIEDYTRFQPLVHALYRLFQTEVLSFSYQFVLVECFSNLFREIVPSNLSSKETILEHSSICFVFLLSQADAIDDNEDLSKFSPTEVSMQCAISDTRVVDPVFVKDQRERIFSRYQIVQKIANKEKVNGVLLKKSNLVPDGFLKRVLSTCTQLGGTEAYEWEADRKRDSNKFQGITTEDDLKPTKLAVYWPKLEEALGNSMFRLIPSLGLKSVGLSLPVITLDASGVPVVFFMRPPCSGPGDIEIYNPAGNRVLHENADTLAVKTAAFFEGNPYVISSGREVKEAIMVCLDQSSSMGEHFELGMSRLSSVKALFNSFANRNMAYNYAHVIGLMLFGSRVRYVCELTPMFEVFKSELEGVDAEGCTSLMDALWISAKRLVKFKATHPDCILRILCLTDGFDDGSQVEAYKVANMLQKNKIVVDGVIIGNECDSSFKGIAQVTSGLIFNPPTLHRGFKIFEHESVLSIRQRSEEKADDVELVVRRSDMKKYGDIPFSQPPKAVIPELVTKPTQSAKRALKSAEDRLNVNNDPLTKCTRRIIKELRQLIKANNPNIHVFPSEEKITFWRILVIGPHDTPYEDGIFALYAHFPSNYPIVPPEIRFVTPIYHCNINSSGRICHSVFGRDYSSSTSVFSMLRSILGLLVAPQPSDPLSTTLTAEYLNDRQTFNENAVAWTLEHATGTPLEQWKAQLLDDESFKEEKEEAQKKARQKRFYDRNRKKNIINQQKRGVDEWRARDEQQDRESTERQEIQEQLELDYEEWFCSTDGSYVDLYNSMGRIFSYYSPKKQLDFDAPRPKIRQVHRVLLRNVHPDKNRQSIRRNVSSSILTRIMTEAFDNLDDVGS